MAKKDYLEQMKSQAERFGKEYVLPTHRARKMGMKDFTRAFCSSVPYGWFYESVLEVSDIGEGGLLNYTGRDSSYYSTPEVGSLGFAALMESYDKYLCSDGCIRFLDTEESRQKFKELDEKYHNEFWEDINRAFAKMGFVPVEDYWVNPETGEEAYY